MQDGHASLKDILLLSITVAITVLSLSILVLTYTVRKYGRPEDDLPADSSDIWNIGSITVCSQAGQASGASTSRRIHSAYA